MTRDLGLEPRTLVGRNKKELVFGRTERKREVNGGKNVKDH